MKRTTEGRLLFYTRDSGGKHEMTPGQYIELACIQALERKLMFDGSQKTIEQMIRNGESRRGDVFLDYDVPGHHLSRPGLDALRAIAKADKTVSHIYIPRRDRLARPADATDGLAIETSLRREGISLLFMDRTLSPLQPGQRPDVGEQIMCVIDYDRAGRDRLDLAQKILLAQLGLAKGGFSIGGRAPYGFYRALVREDGTLVRKLEDQERVRMRGHHVVLLPLNPDHPVWIIIRRILESLETMPASRLAAELTAEGVPSPDAGRYRTDNGVRHPISGVWHQATIHNIARNPLLLAICCAGRRSMGDQLRHSPDGPRVLTADDFRADNQPKVVRNPASSQIVAPARFAPLVDPARHRELLATLDRRAGTQRGKSRSKDAARNPLGGRIYDLNCGWPLYRVPEGASFRYSCGAYMQSHGQRCAHNRVGGPVAARFVLSCMAQKLTSAKLRGKVETRVLQIAIQNTVNQDGAVALAAMRAQLVEVESNLVRVQRNMALAETEARYNAIAEVYDQLAIQKGSLTAEIATAIAIAERLPSPEAEVGVAIRALDHLNELIKDENDLESIGAAFRLVNARLFLGFETVQVKNRALNRVARGIIVFGTAPDPIPLYEGPTGRRGKSEKMAAMVAACPDGETQPDSIVTDGEGNSLGNVNRGDRI